MTDVPTTGTKLDRHIHGEALINILAVKYLRLLQDYKFYIHFQNKRKLECGNETHNGTLEKDLSDVW